MYTIYKICMAELVWVLFVTDCGWPGVFGWRSAPSVSATVQCRQKVLQPPTPLQDQVTLKMQTQSLQVVKDPGWRVAPFPVLVSGSKPQVGANITYHLIREASKTYPPISTMTLIMTPNQLKKSRWSTIAWIRLNEFRIKIWKRFH